ncbi:MAG: lipoprotein [Nitrospinales bacterium]
MPKKTAVLSLLTVLVVVFLFSGCGVKGPPRPPEPKKMSASDTGR